MRRGPWREVSLGQVCDFKYGKSLPAGKRAGGEVPVFGSNGPVGWHNEALTDGPAIIIGRKGSFGEVHYSAVASWPIDTTFYVDHTATNADLRWLSYRLAALGLSRLNRSAAVPGLSREDAYRQRLLVPPPEEQRRIADILDRADELRAKRREALAQLDTLTQSIFLEMFVENRDPSSWPVRPIGELTTLVTKGTTPTSVGYAYTTDGIVFVRAENLSDGPLSLDQEWRYIDERTDVALRRSRLARGDVLIAIAGTIGRVALVPSDAPQMNCNQAVAILRPSPIVEPEFLMEALRTNAMQLRMTKGTVRGTISNLSLGTIKGMPLQVPPLEVQREFSRRLTRVQQLRLAYGSSLRKLDALFASLQHRAFRGEL